MERWLYKTGIAGEVELNVPEIAGKDIKGRLYRDGKEYKPSGNDGTDEPDFTQKQFKYEKVLGKLFFAFEFGAGETIDIPYEDGNE